MNTKRLLLMLVSVALLVALLLIFDIRATISVLKDANIKIVAIGMGLWLVGAVLRSVRWNYLLKKIDIKIPFLSSLKIIIVSNYLANITPARSGDPIRSLLLRQETGPTFSSTISSVITEKIVELAMWVAFSAIAILILPRNEFSGIVMIGIGIYVIGLIVALTIVSSEKRTMLVVKLLHKVFSFIPKIRKIESRLMSSARMISHSTRRYHTKKTIISTVLLTLLVWAVEIPIAYLAFLAIGAEISFWQVALIVPLGIIISILTLLPGGIGSGEAINLALYTTVFGLAPSIVLAGSLLGRFMGYGMYIVFGSILLTTFDKRKKYV